jgi:hypothetical protein
LCYGFFSFASIVAQHNVNAGNEEEKKLQRKMFKTVFKKPFSFILIFYECYNKLYKGHLTNIGPSKGMWVPLTFLKGSNGIMEQLNKKIRVQKRRLILDVATRY